MKQLERIVALAVVVVAATMADGAVDRGQARDGGAPVGSFAVTSVGILTACTNSGGCSAATPTLVPTHAVAVGQGTLSAAGTLCGTFVATSAAAAGTAAPAVVGARVLSGSILSFDPITGQGDVGFSIYVGGGCNGAQFLATGATLVATGTAHAVVSDNGDRIDAVVTNYDKLAGNTAGVVVTMTFTRQER